MREPLLAVRVPEFHECVRCAIGKRPEDHRIHNRVNHRRGARTEAQDKNGDECERWVQTELAQSHSEGIPHGETP